MLEKAAEKEEHAAVHPEPRMRKEGEKKMLTWWMLAGWTCLCLVGLHNRYKLFLLVNLLFIPIIPVLFFLLFFISPPAAGVFFFSWRVKLSKSNWKTFWGKFPNSAPPQPVVSDRTGEEKQKGKERWQTSVFLIKLCANSLEKYSRTHTHTLHTHSAHSAWYCFHAFNIWFSEYGLTLPHWNIQNKPWPEAFSVAVLIICYW